MARYESAKIVVENGMDLETAPIIVKVHVDLIDDMEQQNSSKFIAVHCSQIYVTVD